MMEHWQFYLMRGEFDLNTDNMAIARIFGDDWIFLSSIRQRQILRIRARSQMFTFVSHHVKGMNNPISDALSRYTLGLIKLEENLNDDEKQYPACELKALMSDDTKNAPIIVDK